MERHRVYEDISAKILIFFQKGLLSKVELRPVCPRLFEFNCGDSGESFLRSPAILRDQ